MATWRARSAAAVAVIVSIIGIDELLLAVALGLIAAGFWQVWKPGAYLVPGFTLLWIVLPQRERFVRPPAVSSEKKSERRAG